MFYGDLHLLDILLFAGVAAFLFYRLRGVLGKREGFEKKSNEKYENILDIQDKPKEKKTQKPPELEEKFKQLETAYENLDFFDHISFLENAKSAFETIVGLFNDNNKEELKKLLTPNTHDGFCNAIDKNPEREKYNILSIEIELIEKVWVIGKKIFITVVYLSKQIDQNGKNQVIKKDSWTFEKYLQSRDPIWLLSST